MSEHSREEEDVLANYVEAAGGNKIIRKVLIANNGIAAVKEIRSVRKWAFETLGDDRAVKFVAMATPEDIAANAEYILLADEFVEVPGGSNNNNYANVNLIIELAERTQSDAVWAGWGHASENPLLPDGLSRTERGVSFIGPPASSMRALGDKIASTVIAQSANVPCVPWSGSKETIGPTEECVPDEICARCCVKTPEEAEAVAQKVGYPVMVKASEGGGGKGIRKVLKADDIQAAFRQVEGEVPGSPIFIMALVSASRHLEVQLLADMYGNAISIFGRDCSVQRRHQKIIEEGPVTIAPPVLVKEMERAAVRLAKQVGYVSAGTVEYLYADNKYFFLELNPRLQVEHPVTEMISGVNLPAAQLRVAMGIPLYRMDDIRRMHGLDPNGTDEVDFNSLSPTPKGHVVAVRVTAENPDEGFKPTSGLIQELNFRSTTNVWGYFSVGAASNVHEFADSQIGHIFSRGENREVARKNMVLALKEVSIMGDIRTTVEYISRLLETKAFRTNAYDTAWLDMLIASKSRILTSEVANRDDKMLAVLCGMVDRAQAICTERVKEFTATLERGQAPSSSLLSVTCNVTLILDNIKYNGQITLSGPTSYTVTINGSHVDAEVRLLASGGLLVLFAGKSHVVYHKEEATGLRLQIDGKTYIFSEEYDPTRIRSSSTGKLVRCLVENESHVDRGQAIVEIEVMKMYMPLVAPESGIIHFTRAEGGYLTPGCVIATLDLDDPSQVKKATLFSGTIPAMTPSHVIGDRPHRVLGRALESLKMIFAGYDNQSDLFDKKLKDSIRNLVGALSDPYLPLLEFSDLMSSLSSRIPPEVRDEINSLLEAYRQSVESMSVLVRAQVSFPANHILESIDNYAATLDNDTSFRASVEPFVELARRHSKGIEGHTIATVSSLLEEYLRVEKYFDRNTRREEVVLDLRNQKLFDMHTLVTMARSNNMVKRKSAIVIALLHEIGKGKVGKIDSYVPIIHELADLSSKGHTPVALTSRHLLIKYQLPSFNQRRAAMEDYFRTTVQAGNPATVKQRIMELVDRSLSIVDVLSTFFVHRSVDIQKAAIEVYVRRAYRAYELYDVKTNRLANRLRADWLFRLPSVPNNSVDSSDNLAAMGAEVPMRTGMMMVFSSINEVRHSFTAMMEAYQPTKESLLEDNAEEFTNVLNIWLMAGDATSSSPTANSPRPGMRTLSDDSDCITRKFAAICQERKGMLMDRRIRRVTLAIDRPESDPEYYTFRANIDYAEDQIYRNIEPPLAFQLEIRRLCNFNIRFIPTENKSVHFYFAEEAAPPPGRSPDRRFFVRGLIRQTDTFSSANSFDLIRIQGERVLSDVLDTLELLSADKRFEGTDCNCIFLNFLPNLTIEAEKLRGLARELVTRHGMRIWKQRIRTAEVKINAMTSPESRPLPLRVHVESVSGFVTKVYVYLEVKDVNTGMAHFKTITTDGKYGSWEGQPVTMPYPPADETQPSRRQAQNIDTAYVYDFPEIFNEGVEEMWRQHKAVFRENSVPMPSEPFKSVELVLHESGRLQECNRPAGQNTIGMVAWRFTMCTPEYPDGRDVIVISNDITYQIGSFGTKEDHLFNEASKMARALGIPRIYLSANSGARIGLANEIKKRFRIAWINAQDANMGFRYIYLSEDDYKSVPKDALRAERIEDEGEVRWKITDIIGTEQDLGVENLQGSGMIAGETSKAYEDIFTLSIVTSRSVGIGAYLVRLGQRTIHNKAPPILLTGANALNQLLGREVYTSNEQIGGIKIMYANGVSHLVCDNNMGGVVMALQWLAYVPRTVRESVKRMPCVDPIDRRIAFRPATDGTAYDPRCLIAGMERGGEWVGGFFDRGSWIETLGGWAKGVVCGRARLGGIPMGVIAVETRTVETVVPADPAAPDTQEMVLQEAGQVWYPNSAFKTAQAIDDFNNGERLPLMIFANWRGFSGGMRDMYDQVLKYGAYIVDSLRRFNQPIFVYIPPGGELRGGAWVVVDPSINPSMMEMYADTSARGGVLEPKGVAGVKFREKDLKVTMRRCDDKMVELCERLANAQQSGNAAAIEGLEQEIKQREELLLPMYQQVATQFAALHDTPVRMKAKGVISEIVPWERAREYFHWRLRRRLAEQEVAKKVRDAGPPGADAAGGLDAVAAWWREDHPHDASEDDSEESSDYSSTGGGGGGGTGWADDRAVTQWLEGTSFDARVAAVRRASVAAAAEAMAREDADAVLQGLLRAVDPEQRKRLLDRLK